MMEIENVAPRWAKVILKKTTHIINKPKPCVDEAGCENFKALFENSKISDTLELQEPIQSAS